MNEILGLLILIAIPMLSVYALVGIIELIIAPFKLAFATKANIAPQLVEARLRKSRLAIKRSQRTLDFYEDTSFNPATGMPMLTDTVDIGGNDCSCVGGI